MPAYGSGDSLSFAAEDGKSLICLLRDPSGQANCDYPPNPGPWRKWIDMEHSTCYSKTNHWSALSDGKMKYIFRAYFGDEQLFNLTSDPEETVDVSVLPTYTAELALWRQRLVEQFETEGRGEAWVKDGNLVKRTQNQAKGPNYPGYHPPSPSPPPIPPPSPSVGDMVLMHKRGTGSCNTNDCWSLQDAGPNSTSLQLVDFPLCLALVNDSSLEVQTCASSGEAAVLQWFTTKNHTSSATTQAAVISHVPSGRCLSAVSVAGQTPELKTCDEMVEEQLWIFGSSGRMCAKSGARLCLRVMPHTGDEHGIFVV